MSCEMTACWSIVQYSTAGSKPDPMGIKFVAGFSCSSCSSRHFRRAQSEAQLSAGFALKDANVEGLKLHYTRSLPEADRKAYIDAYSRPGRMRAAWQYFVSWPQTAKDFAELSRTKLTMPVLSIGGDKSLGKELGQQMKLLVRTRP
jgi:hypothetical protein